jgi:hypothetical protein
MSKKRKTIEHMYLPDTQLRPGVPTNHLPAAANYACSKRPNTIIIGGDWWDLPSLSSYEKPGSQFFEGVSLEADIEFGNEAMDEFLGIIAKERGYSPRIVFTEGNHEYRMMRAINDDPTRLAGLLGRHNFRLPGVEYHNFLDIVTIDGIMYSHYFCNPQSLMRGVLGGQMDNRLNKLKRSFTQGHQQTLMTGSQYLPDGSRIRGLVAGAFYQHDEEYAGPQGHNYWRGCIYKHEVVNGDYDLMELSLPYLVEHWS